MTSCFASLAWLKIASPSGWIKKGASRPKGLMMKWRTTTGFAEQLGSKDKQWFDSNRYDLIDWIKRWLELVEE